MNLWIKRTLYALFLFLLIGAALVASILTFHREAIVKKAVEAANAQFVGKLTVESSRIALLNDFPYISIDLQGVAFFENKALDATPFYKAEHLYLGFNAWDILANRIRVKSIHIREGYIHLVKYTHGEFNLLMAKGIVSNPSDADANSEMMAFDIAKLKISGFKLSLEDRSDSLSYLITINDWKSSIRNHTDTSSFDVKGDLFFEHNRSGMPQLFSGKTLNVDLNVIYDRQQQVLTLNPSHILLADALFASSGKVSFAEEGLEVDLRLEGQKPDFNLLGAFLPNDLAVGLNDYKHEGEIFFKGTIRGMLGEGHFPLVSLEFGCENAFIQRTENELRLDELRFFGFYTNGAERSIATSELHIQNFNAKPEQGVFQGDLSIRNFEDPYVKVRMKADLDLAFLSDFFKWKDFEGVSGKIRLNMDFDELVDLDASTAGLAHLKKSVQSELILTDLNFVLEGYPHTIRRMNAHASMQNGQLEVKNLSFSVLDSDFAIKGKLSDFPAIFHRVDKEIAIDLEVQSDKIDLAQLRLTNEENEKITELRAQVSILAKARELLDHQYLPKGRLTVEKFQAKLENYPHTLTDVEAAIRIGDRSVEIEKLAGKIDQSDLLLKASLDNYPKWFQESLEGMTTIKWALQSERLNISDLLTNEGFNYLPGIWSKEVITSLELQGSAALSFRGGLNSVDLHIETLSGTTQLHPLQLENMRGIVKWEKDYLSVKDFGGKMGLSEFRMELGLNLKDSVSAKKDFFRLRAPTLDLDALMGFKGFQEATNHAEAFNIFNLPLRDMEFAAEIGKLHYHANWIEQVNLKARTSTDHWVHIDTLRLNVAKGSLGLKGYLNGSNPEKIYLQTELSADRLDLDKLLFKFEQSGKDLMINNNLKGRLSGTLSGRFLVYPDLTPIIDRSEAKMELTVYDGNLINFAPFSALSAYFSHRNLNRVRFDTLTNTFELKAGKLHIPRMNINSSLGFMELSGWQHLNTQMDYELRIPLSLVTQVGLRSVLGGRSNDQVDPEQEDAIVFRDGNRRVRFLTINMQGTPENFKISLGRQRKKSEASNPLFSE